MKIWLDDMRTPPDDSWIWVQTAAAAIALIRENPEAEIVSLDYDLGGTWDSMGGDKVADFIAGMNPEFRPLCVRLHTWNPAGADQMRAILRPIYGLIQWTPAKGIRSA